MLRVLIAAASVGGCGASAAGAGGLTLTAFTNTALRGSGASTVLGSLEAVPTCTAASCGAPSSVLLTGQVKPPAAGRYGFQLTLDPPLPYPSSEAYAR